MASSGSIASEDGDGTKQHEHYELSTQYIGWQHVHNEPYGEQAGRWIYSGDEHDAAGEHYELGNADILEEFYASLEPYVLAEIWVLAEIYAFEEIFAFGRHYGRFFVELYGTIAGSWQCTFEVFGINFPAEFYGITFEEHYGGILQRWKGMFLQQGAFLRGPCVFKAWDSGQVAGCDEAKFQQREASCQ